VNLRGLRRWWRSLASVSPYDEPELVSLDLETSSLDPKAAEILSIAAVPVRGRQVVLSERFERTVRANAAVDPEAVKEGMRVEAVFAEERIGSPRDIAYFRPIG